MHAVTLHATDAYPDDVSAHEPSGPSIGGRPIAVGDVFEVETGAVAHGGHVVARVGDVVAFTRHALPGELVRIRVSDVRSRFLRADVIDVVRAHPQRRAPLCSVSAVCGGCDFQHANEELQRKLKFDVIREALIRHGRLHSQKVDELLAEGVIDLGTDTGWRSRMRYRVGIDGAGRPAVGMFAHRSDEWVDASSCVIADPVGHQMAKDLAAGCAPGDELLMAVGADGPRVERSGVDGPDVRHRIVIEGEALEFHTPLDGFWQVHPRLVQALVNRLIERGAPRPGQTWWDLYAGTGPLAGALGMHVGAQGLVEAVESSAGAVERGRTALADMPWVRWHRSDVGRWLTGQRLAKERGKDRAKSRGKSRGQRSRPDGVVLDPPRSGAGGAVLAAVCGHRPQVIAYVACDPVALGRDTAIAGELGYELVDVRVWDAFPQTHHMEAMAIFQPTHQIS